MEGYVCPHRSFVKCKFVKFTLLQLSPEEFIHLIQEITDKIKREWCSSQVFKPRSYC